MLGQWKKFLKENDKYRLYKLDFSYIAVPWLVKHLHKAIKRRNKKDIESIIKTLRVHHSIILDSQGNLCFNEFMGYYER